MPLSADEQRLGAIIPEHYHYQMLLDEARMVGFRRALELVITPGARVLDLGGGTGVMSSFAAACGAQVWCVERQDGLARRARILLDANGTGASVEVVSGAVEDFLPPQAVDVVICEMLHSALLREKQVEVIEDFRRRHHQKFGTQPIFVPTATLLGVEPVAVDFDFFGYTARLPLFEDPANPLERVRSLGPVSNYAIVDYHGTLPRSARFDGRLQCTAPGRCSALRFVTQNILALDQASGNTIDWKNQHLIVPLSEDVELRPGRELAVQFAYAFGAEIPELLEGLSTEIA